MLDYKIINYKPLLKRDNKQFVDLMANSFDSVDMNDGQFVYITKYYIARPDLVSLVVYDTDDYADIICKVNGISNPFELNEGMIVFCPSVDTLLNCYKYDSTASDIVSKNDELTKKISSYQREKSSKRTPNEQTIGEQNFIIDKSLGLVFY